MEDNNNEINQENKDVFNVKSVDADSKNKINLNKSLKMSGLNQFFKKCTKLKWITLIILAFLIIGVTTFVIAREFDGEREGHKREKTEKGWLHEGESKGKFEKDKYRNEDHHERSNKGDKISEKSLNKSVRKEREEGKIPAEFETNLLIQDAKITVEDAIKTTRDSYPDCKISDVGVGYLNGKIVFNVHALDKDGGFIQLQIDASDASILKMVIDNQNK